MSKCVTRGDGRTRSSHDALDGKIFDKNDPFLKTHTPPWEFNCRCWLEEIMAKEAGKDVQPMTAPENVHVDSESGFVFDPEHAFDTQDISNIKPVSRRQIIQDAADAVRDGKLGSVGMIVAPPQEGAVRTSPMPNLPQVKQGFDAMKDKAREKLVSVGLDPDHLPDYKKAIRLLRETLGNPNCRVVVSLKHSIKRTSGHKQDICLKKIVLHNEIKGTYCVMIYDEDKQQLKLVSWNNAPTAYGDSEWTLT